MLNRVITINEMNTLKHILACLDQSADAMILHCERGSGPDQAMRQLTLLRDEVARQSAATVTRLNLLLADADG